MSICVLHGQNGGAGLAVKVVGGAQRPENPKDGTIWVNTEQKLTAWAMRSTAPGNPVEGMVWLTINAESKVNALKKNEISIKPIRANQYIGGAWTLKQAEMYQDGTWGALKTTPDFTYTGTFELVDDADNRITDSTDGNWKIRFLTSGTLTFQNLNGAKNGIDVFLVGGGGAGGASCYVNAQNPLWGGGGGGGGYTNTKKAVSVTEGTAYAITVGAGGTGVSGGNGNEGGSSSAFGVSANGGKGGYAGTTQTNGRKGGAGGSGGGGGGKYSSDTGSSSASGAGGSDGGDGGGNGGTGQGTTTREFGESTGTLYAGGGGGAKSSAGSDSAGGSGGGTDGNGSNANANTGGGGGGGSTPANGGSGIVVIRNKR